MESESFSSPTKSLNPNAKSWEPGSHNSPTETSLPLALALPQKQIDQGIKSPDQIYAHDKHQPQQPYIYHDVPTQYFYFQSFPFHIYFSSVFVPPTLQLGYGLIKDVGVVDGGVEKESLVEGERELKRLLKIGGEFEEEESVCGRLMPPSGFRRRDLSCGTKKSVCQKWRAKILNPSASPPPGVPSSATPPTACINTTVMIKNVPNQYRRDLLMGFIDQYCREHKLEYDFFYLPMDFRSKDNLGFAFVNFTAAASALRMKELLQGYRWGEVETPRGRTLSKKICEMTWARIQGKKALVQHFEKSNFICDDEDYLPVVLCPPRNGFNTFTSKMTNVAKMQGQFKGTRVVENLQ